METRDLFAVANLVASPVTQPGIANFNPPVFVYPLLCKFHKVSEI